MAKCHILYAAYDAHKPYTRTPLLLLCCLSHPVNYGIIICFYHFGFNVHCGMALQHLGAILC